MALSTIGTNSVADSAVKQVQKSVTELLQLGILAMTQQRGAKVADLDKL